MLSTHTTTEQLPAEIITCIERALQEDIGTADFGAGDVTTNSILPADASMRGQIIAKQPGVVAGLDVARQVFMSLDERVSFETRVPEGACVENRQVLATLSG